MDKGACATHVNNDPGGLLSVGGDEQRQVTNVLQSVGQARNRV